MRKTSKNLSLKWQCHLLSNISAMSAVPAGLQAPSPRAIPILESYLIDNNNKLLIHIPYIYKLTKTKGESNCQASFDAINLYILHLSTTSCQYWVKVLGTGY